MTFASGPAATALRASGLAAGPDGSLYIAADASGKIWRVVRSSDTRSRRPRRPDSQATGPAVGEPAPDFTLPAATRAGVGDRPVRLSEFKGKTVVLAFFFKARTAG